MKLMIASIMSSFSKFLKSGFPKKIILVTEVSFWAKIIEPV